jgi:mitochondrial fission protein ELM1
LIVGGPTLFWNLDDRALLTTLANMLAEAASDGGSVLVTTSPRTPGALEEEIAKNLAAANVPTLVAPPGGTPAYAGLLDAADSIRVTADSVSMISDAMWTGRPVGVVPVTNTRIGTMYMGLMSRLRPARPVYPQDLRFFWDELARIGVSQDLNVPQTSSDREMRRILDRVTPLLNRCDG